jgi:hypothetical protein
MSTSRRTPSTALLRVWLSLELSRRWRSLAVLALLIAIATGTVLTAVAGARRGASSVDRLLAETRPTTVVVLPNEPGFDWNKIRALPEVETLTTFPVSDFGVEGIPMSANVAQFPPADKDVLRGIERPVVLEGRVFDPTRVDEVVVTPKFPASYHKRVGDWVTLQLISPAEFSTYDSEQGVPPHGPRVKARIVGVIRSGWFSDQIGSKGQVVASPALFTQHRASFMGPSGEDNVINSLARLKGGAAAIPAFKNDLAKASGRTDIDVWANDTKFTEPATRTNDFEAVSLLAFGLAALAAAFVLVGQSVARYSAATAGELRTMRAVGMTPRQGISAASAAPLLAGVAGATLGVVIAVVASRWMPIGAAALVEPDPGVDVDWLVLGIGWVVIPALVVAGAAFAAAFAFTAADRTAGRRSAVALGAARAGLPVPVVVGARFALEPGRGRSAVPVRPAISGAVAGVLGVLAVFTFSAGVSDAATNPARFGQTYQAEAFLGFNGEESPSVKPVLAAAARDPGVLAVNDGRTAVSESGTTSIATYTYAPVATPLPTVLTKGRMPVAPSEVVLAPLTAKHMDVGVGSRVSLTGGQSVTFTVTGIGFVPTGPHNDYSDGGWITPAGFDTLYKEAKFPYKFRLAEVALRPGADAGTVIKRLNAATAAIKGTEGVKFAPPEPLAKVQEIRDVRVLPVILAAFLAILAVGAVGHALATAVHRRRHEVAVLRALGMTRTQSRWVVITQATLLATIGLAFGVPLGLALGRTLWRMVAGFAPLAYVPPVALWALLFAVPVALLVANLLAAWPSRLAARLRIGHTLRAE